MKLKLIPVLFIFSFLLTPMCYTSKETQENLELNETIFKEMPYLEEYLIEQGVNNTAKLVYREKIWDEEAYSGLLRVSLDRSLIVERRKAGEEDFEKLAEIFHVSDSSVNESEIYSTGYRNLSESELREILPRITIIDTVELFGAGNPSTVDLTQTIWFPPIGDQGSEGSCTAWANGYYLKTYQEAKEHNWNLSGATWNGDEPSPVYQSKIMSPEFVYHLINRGKDEGSNHLWALWLFEDVGICTWENMPYDDIDHTSWPVEDAWKEAAKYRCKYGTTSVMLLDTDEDLEELRTLLSEGNIATISVDAGFFLSGFDQNDVWTADTYFNVSTNHAQAIVGYNDLMPYSEDGVTTYGAFKVVNSYGVGGGWEKVPDGCYWISYKAMKETVQYACIAEDLTDYTPSLLAGFQLDHYNRSNVDIFIADEFGNYKFFTGPVLNYDYYGSQTVLPFPDNRIYFDITEFRENQSHIGNIEYAIGIFSKETTLLDNYLTYFSVECTDWNQSTLLINETSLTTASLHHNFTSTGWDYHSNIWNQTDIRDNNIEYAQGANNVLYAAFIDWSEVAGRNALHVIASYDNGLSWSPIRVTWITNSELTDCAIAVDPNNDNIYVAVEREWTTDDHDILLYRRIDGVWSLVSVDNIADSDDMNPSITSEYQYTANWQYIAYEHAYTYDDRDLRYANSTNNGETWSTTPLQGELLDWKVYSKPYITNGNGTLYISYRVSEDYETTGDIYVDCSHDFGETWMTHLIEDIALDCDNPKTAGLPYSKTSVTVYEVSFSAEDTDIAYSHTTDAYDTTYRNYLFYSEKNEQTPGIANDYSVTGNTFKVTCNRDNYLLTRHLRSQNLTNPGKSTLITHGRIKNNPTVLTTYNNRTIYLYQNYYTGDIEATQKTGPVNITSNPDNAETALFGCNIQLPFSFNSPYNFTDSHLSLSVYLNNTQITKQEYTVNVLKTNEHNPCFDTVKFLQQTHMNGGTLTLFIELQNKQNSTIYYYSDEITLGRCSKVSLFQRLNELAAIWMNATPAEKGQMFSEILNPMTIFWAFS